MEAISEYIFCAFVASLAAGVAELLSDSGAMQKYVRLLSSLVLLVLLFAPLKTLAASLTTLPIDTVTREEVGESTPSYDYIVQQVSKKVSAAIAQDLEKTFSLDGVSVVCEMVQEETGSFLIKQIQVWLPQAYSAQVAHIQEYVSSTYQTTAYVGIQGE